MNSFVSIRISKEVKGKLLQIKGELQTNNPKKNVTIDETINKLVEVYLNGRIKTRRNNKQTPCCN